jgi:hypothetical protein
MFEPPGRKMPHSPAPPGSSGQYPGPGPYQGMNGQPSPMSAGNNNGNGPAFTRPLGPAYTRPLNGNGQPGAQPYPPSAAQTAQPPYPGNPSQQNLPPWSQGNGTGTLPPPNGPGMPPMPAPNMSGMNWQNPNMSGMNWQKNGMQQKFNQNNQQQRRKNRRIFIRARDKYHGLSTRGKVLCMILVIAILIPSLAGVFELINGVILYTQVEGGMSHVRAAASVFQGGQKGDSSKYFDVDKLEQAQSEMDAAHASFVALSDELDHDGSIALAGSMLPTQLASLRKIGHIAVDGTAAGQAAIKTAIEIAPQMSPALKKSSNPNQAYLDQNSYNKVVDLMATIAPLVHDMSNDAQGISLTGLPLSASQQQTVTTLLTILPVVDGVLAQAPQYKNALGWLLGVGQQRSFLLEPMDSAELRSTGGFTGQFGELTFAGGHMAPLKLQNIGAYEENHSGLPGGSPPISQTIYDKVVNQTAPPAYATWWPVANFGVRDANVSADFPITAKIIENYYDNEFSTQVSGVILFTPALIKQILHVTGPIHIDQYNETITEQNLEDKLHYYQLNNNGIYREQVIEHIKDSELARKAFTQRVTKQLMDMVFHLPVDKLLPMAAQMLQAMKTKDLQIYFDNTQLEGLIGKYGSTDSMDRSTTHDGLYVVQENLSASKASQYVTTSIKDSVVVDAQGNATHTLNMTLDYQKKGDVYGADTYRDYVRVYAPEGSTLISGNGFAQTDLVPQCGDAPYAACQADVYNDGSLVCSTPVTVGYPISYIKDFTSGTPTVPQIGAPPKQTSDETGRGMFGGWVVIPANCTLKVSLSWTVPAMSQHGYGLMFQAQAGIATNLDLTVQTPTCSSGNLHYASTLHGQDMIYNVPKGNCTLQSKAS